jgi:uncharacterized LabA/DUF88 family protein
MNTTEDGAQTAPGAPMAGASTPTQPANEKSPSSGANRRRRAPSKRRSGAENTAAPVAAPADEGPTPTAEAQPAASGTLAEPAERPQPSARPRRARNARNRRPGVELVLPATESEPVVGEPADAPTDAAGRSHASETASAETHAAEAPIAPAEAPPTDTTPSPARRYRFERPTRQVTQTSAAPAVRPERLSGRMVNPSQPETPANPPVEPDESLESLLSAIGRGAADETAVVEPSDSGVDTVAQDEPPLLEPDVEPLAEGAGSESMETAESPEGTTAARRRRRRRRTSVRPTDVDGAEADEQPQARPGGLSVVEFSAPTTPAGERRQSGAFEVQPAEPEEPYAPFSAPYTPGMRDRGARPAQPGWNLSGAPQRIGQPDSPYAAPEPAFPRGFGPQPRGVAGPVREPYTPRASRTERGMDAPPISANQLASVVSSAIQQQTDRLLTELRRQAPPASMTVAMPPFPSIERVGVFVDVANVVYSARNLRVQLDFGRLLDFLRGNRRLIRAHAYAPTSPEPQADQAFLSVVKGVGYRITTKNYKTFSSGAKKADLDLDMCMDIVRLVDSGAVETVVLVSGDSDFLPLLEYCSDKGVRVEVAAFDDSAAAILRQSCDLFINLSLVDDILV